MCNGTPFTADKMSPRVEIELGPELVDVVLLIVDSRLKVYKQLLQPAQPGPIR